MSENFNLSSGAELSETRLRAFVDAVFDAYYDWHIQTGYMEMSSQMDVLLRLASGELPRSFYAWLDRVHPDDRRQTLINNQRAVERGGTYEGDYRLRRGDGTYVQVHDRGVILRDDRGLSAHMIGAIRDITEQGELRRALEASHESLLRQTAALEDANTALRVILDQRNRDRAELERSIVENVETMIVPLLDRLQHHLERTPEAIYVDAVAHNLRELVHPFAQAIEAAVAGSLPLTRRELEIANLIRAGKSSSEIAEALYISPTTVAFHRKNLRRKLGLAARGPLLSAHLARLPRQAEELVWSPDPVKE